ncbi:unnamed protein product [Bursaphelenchus okinawaensis]|uniref:Chromatin target of PRMT1 protein C-terminal domain-containing protein n=1 Tax=Bursaphelenchus okinawaensis TaxID=465554 RepID=A0A811JRJ4_9BILA|nr:unnamed protein product [Bursaphelenchus okinawaensis]CAG9079778.1 unnamed protein product [Bursaphelenchus okinawaensis]
MPGKMAFASQINAKDFMDKPLDALVASVRKAASKSKNNNKVLKTKPAGFNQKASHKKPAGFNNKTSLKKPAFNNKTNLYNPEKRQRFNGQQCRRPVRNVLQEIVGNNRRGQVEEVVRVVRQPRRMQRQRPQLITIIKHVPATPKVTKRTHKPNKIAKKGPVFKHKKAPKQKMTREQLDAELDAYMSSSKKTQQ